MRSARYLVQVSSQFEYETPGVNFTNILQAAFTRADPKIAKKTVKFSSFIALLGSSHVKAARRTLVKLTPDLEDEYEGYWNSGERKEN